MENIQPNEAINVVTIDVGNSLNKKRKTYTLHISGSGIKLSKEKASNLLKNNFAECPYLLDYFLGQMSFIYEKEPGVLRTGLPRTGPRPMGREKELFALFKTIPGLKLKDFSEAYGIGYGVVRLWNREPRVKEVTETFEQIFAVFYVEELVKRAQSKKFDIEKYGAAAYNKATANLTILCPEFGHYKNTIQDLIVFLLMKAYESKKDQQLVLGSIISRLIDARRFHGHNIYNPPGDKTTYEEDIKSTGELAYKITTEFLSRLKGLIKKGEVKAALNLLDVLGEWALRDIESSTDLRISVLYKGKKREGVNFGKQKAA